MPTRTTRVPSSVARGLRPTSAATLPQPLGLAPDSPTVAISSRRATAPWWSARGMEGQKIQRRPSTSKAGSRVSDASMAPAMPMAPTGPSPRVDPRSASSRQSRPRITVVPEATIGSTDARQATFIASQGDSKLWSSSL
mgnify:CR=1 FL=1